MTSDAAAGELNVLAIDTALAQCAVAVRRHDAKPHCLGKTMRHGQAEALLPMIAAAMEGAGIGYGALDLIAVTVGPGSFTGIRVGIAAARGLALAAGAPVVGVSTLAALAASATPPPDAQLLALADSRRGDVFAQRFRGDTVLEEPAIVDAARAAELAAACGHVTGDAAAAGLAPAPGFTLHPPVLPDIAAVLALGAAQHATGTGLPPRPLYLRPPDVSAPQRDKARRDALGGA